MDLFDPKPGLQKWSGKPLPRVDDQGPEARLHQADRGGAGQPAHVQAATAKRHRVLRLHPPHRLLRRRHLPGAVDVSPRRSTTIPASCCCSAAACSSGGRPWAHGSLYGLGSESQNLPGLRGAELGRRAPARGASNWSQRLSAVDLSGRDVPQFGRPGAVPVEPARRDARDAARGPRRAARPEPGPLRRDRRPRDRLAHRVLRTGVPHADGGAGAARFLEGVAGDAARCTASNNEPTQAVRHQLPAGAPHGGARRALRHADARELGPPHRPQHAS